MTYYKMIQNNKIVGIACSNDFIAFSPVIESFLRSDERRGEFISWHGNIYRDTWMQPIQFHVDFIAVEIREITEEEYRAFEHAFEINDVIEHEHEQEEPIEWPEYADPVELNSIEFLRESKINEMSRACRLTIEDGFDLAIRGEIRHFSLTTQDQLNLMSLSALAQTQSLIPYHADGEEQTFYTSDEINTIMQTATELKIYNTTYFNALKDYINALDSIEAVTAVTYGIEIPDEYKSDVLKILET